MHACTSPVLSPLPFLFHRISPSKYQSSSYANVFVSHYICSTHPSAQPPLPPSPAQSNRSHPSIHTSIPFVEENIVKRTGLYSQFLNGSIAGWGGFAFALWRAFASCGRICGTRGGGWGVSAWRRRGERGEEGAYRHRNGLW